MKLKSFLCFGLIMAGANALMTVMFTHMYYHDALQKPPPDFQTWVGQDHTWLLLVLLGVDCIATAVFWLNMDDSGSKPAEQGE